MQRQSPSGQPRRSTSHLSRPIEFLYPTRADQVDREALARLVRSISRFLDPAEAVAATTSGEVSLRDSRSMGSPWLADRLWERLAIGQAILAQAGGRRLEAQAVERAILAMVTNRLSVKPLSKL